ncbi:MAG: hypothetical protein OQJ89_13200, partial [Kangiellaceae bacterium]|nr:hypothetical protein [Kangiellaceae bacterium]
MSIGSNKPEELDEETLNKIARSYASVSTELPSSDIDRQIIAAAHRELANPTPRKLPKDSWWRRVSLPIYAAATFAFTAVATHWLWPEEPARVPPGTTPGPVKIDLLPSEPQIQQRESREPRELPKYRPPELEPVVETQKADGTPIVKSNQAYKEVDSTGSGGTSSSDNPNEFTQKEQAAEQRDGKLHFPAAN